MLIVQETTYKICEQTAPQRFSMRSVDDLETPREKWEDTVTFVDNLRDDHIKEVQFSTQSDSVEVTPIACWRI